jgi:hypothetical protein
MPTNSTETCQWYLDEDTDSELWLTTCGHSFQLYDAGPADNKMKFCCYCGKPLTEVRSDVN